MAIKNEAKIITKITIIAFVFNGLLLALKIILGILGKSGAVITSAIDSGLDIIASAIILFVGRYSRKKADKSHHYGHEKFESIIAIILGIIMIFTSIQLIIYGVDLLVKYFNGTKIIQTPNALALIAVTVTIIVKLVLFFITRKAAKKAKAPSLKAMAIDHISDVIVSVVIIGGVLAAIHGLVYLEPIAGIVVALFIGYHGFNIIYLSIGQVVDEAASKEMNKAIRLLAENIDGVKRVDVLKSRKFGMKLFVDIEIAVDGHLSVDKSHDIAEKVRYEVENSFDLVKHCMVHVNPFKQKDTQL